jgi:hypothetical protein
MAVIVRVVVRAKPNMYATFESLIIPPRGIFRNEKPKPLAGWALDLLVVVGALGLLDSDLTQCVDSLDSGIGGYHGEGDILSHFLGSVSDGMNRFGAKDLVLSGCRLSIVVSLTETDANFALLLGLTKHGGFQSVGVSL